MGAPDTGAMSDSKYTNPVALRNEHRDGRPIWKSALAWVVTTQFLRTDTSSYQLGSSMRHLNEAPAQNPPSASADADSIHREIVWSHRLSTLAQNLEQSHRLAEHSKTATFPEDPYRIGQVGQVWTGLDRFLPEWAVAVSREDLLPMRH